MILCDDVDLLHWEPNIFRDAVFASQLLLAGTGDLAESAFTIGAGSLETAQVRAGCVIVLGGSVAGSFPILSVDSETQLTLSAMHEGALADGEAPVAVGVGTAGTVEFAVRTFWPQRKVVSDLVVRAGGIEPDEAGVEIVNRDALKRACALGTLQMIYSALAAVAEEPAELAIRADLYERLYRRALHQSRIEIDTNGDGRAEITRHLGVLKMVRG